MNIAINGFGRIGRAITKLSFNFSKLKIKLINDINPNVENLSYLLKYDSTYGTFDKEVKTYNNSISIDNKIIKTSSYSNISKLHLIENKIDVLIDSSGIKRSKKVLKKIIKKNDLKYLILTNSSNVSDIEVIMGINENKINKDHKIISSSICDANAISHVIKWIDEKYDIINGSITTLHPWLSYQNLSDGIPISQSNPSVPWNDFSLGRSASNNLIPKNTTALDAISKILPAFSKKFISFSYRTPMEIVTSADILINLRQKADYEDIKKYLINKSKASNFVVTNKNSLVSRDFIKNEYSCVIDLNWLKTNLNTLKLIVWYDNEWAYSKRVLDLINYIRRLK